MNRVLVAVAWIGCLVLGGCRTTNYSTRDFALDRPEITQESFREDLGAALWTVLMSREENVKNAYVLTNGVRQVFLDRNAVAREMFAMGYTEIPVERAAEWQIYRVDQWVEPIRFDIVPSNESGPPK